MSTTIKPNYQSTYHRDGSVSYWNVYAQQWERTPAKRIADQVLASMSSEERERIAKHAQADRQ